MLKAIGLVSVVGLAFMALLAPVYARASCGRPIHGHLAVKGGALYFSGPALQMQLSESNIGPVCSYRYHLDQRRFVIAPNVVADPSKLALMDGAAGLKPIPIDRPNLEDRCALKLTQMQAGQAHGVVSCDLWGRTRRMKVKLKHEAIGRFSRPALGYDHLRRNDAYWVSIVVPGGEMDDIPLGSVVFARNGVARYNDKPLDCFAGYGELRRYANGTLCQGNRGVWEWISNGVVSQLPQPCSAPQQLVYWKQQLWGLMRGDEGTETWVCQYDRPLAQAVQTFRSTVDIDASLAANAPAARGRVSHWRAFHAEHDHGPWRGITVYLSLPLEVADWNCKQLVFGSGESIRDPCVGGVMGDRPIVESSGGVHYLRSFPLPVSKLRMKMVRVDGYGGKNRGKNR